MKMSKTSKRTYNIMNKFPSVKKEPQKGQVWFALFPYETLGNMEKIRPVLIEKVKENYVVARMITTNANKGIELDMVQNKLFKKSYNSTIDILVIS